MMRHRFLRKRVNSASQHDIKLELDVRCQRLIEKGLRQSFPEIPVLGEEGISGPVDRQYRWVVDPIDGTVNFAYGIPHACVAIALQARRDPPSREVQARCFDQYETLVGVVYDPFLDELWTASEPGRARLNGKPIKASERRNLEECILATGFSKSRESLEVMLSVFNSLVYRARKIRMMGSAALALCWVADGRLDAFVENGVHLWDILAGGFVLEKAGGEFYCRSFEGEGQRFRMIANNGRVRKQIQQCIKRSQV